MNTVKQDGGTVNVFVGNGQPLVLGGSVNQLATVQDPFDSSRLTVALQTPAARWTSAATFPAAPLGGLLDFRSEQLDPARNALGRIAVALTDVVNTQHREGMDLTGALGGDFFAVGGVDVLDSTLNSGTGTVAAYARDVGALTGRDYILEMTGSGWALRDSQTGAAVPMTGTGTARRSVRRRRPRDRGRRHGGRRRPFLIRPTRGAIGGHERADHRSVADRRGGADPHGRGHWKFRLRRDLGGRSARQHERAAAQHR